MPRAPVRRVILVLGMAGLLSGCLTSAETKQASTQLQDAIDQYARNITAFERAWIAEVDKVGADLQAAFVARAVKRRVDTLSRQSNGFANREWRDRIAQTGLIGLSDSIDAERDRARDYLALLQGRLKKALKAHKVGDPPGVPPAAGRAAREILSVINASIVEEARAAIANPTTAALLSPEDLAQLRQRANSAPFADDPVAVNIAEQWIWMHMLKAEIPRNLGDLKTVVRAMAKAHKQVDAWIQTDVRVSGADVAGLVNSWSAELGER